MSYKNISFWSSLSFWKSSLSYKDKNIGSKNWHRPINILLDSNS